MVKPKTLTEDVQSRLHWIRVARAGASLRNFPDFLIVGPQRTGTTWLFYNLRGHPEIFLPGRRSCIISAHCGGPITGVSDSGTVRITLEQWKTRRKAS